MNSRVEQLLNKQARIEEELAEAFRAEESWPRRIQLSLCSSKDSNWDVINRGELGGMSEEGQRTFSYALYEVLFDIEVNQDGTYKILSVKDGKEFLTASPARR